MTESQLKINIDEIQEEINDYEDQIAEINTSLLVSEEKLVLLEDELTKMKRLEKGEK